MKTEQTVPCARCKTPTPMLGTKLCNNCWEITRRAPDYWELRKYKERTEAALVEACSFIQPNCSEDAFQIEEELKDLGLWREPSPAAPVEREGGE